MRTKSSTTLAVCLLSLGAVLMIGCEQLITSQARSSFTSFVTGILTSGVNEVLNP